MIQGEITKERMEGWKFDSSCEEGFHEIIAPGKADCEQEYIYRLNLSAGKSFDLGPENWKWTLYYQRCS